MIDVVAAAKSKSNNKIARMNECSAVRQNIRVCPKGSVMPYYAKSRVLLWIMLFCILIVMLLTWLDAILQPIAISDSVLHVVKTSDEANVHSDLAELLQNGRFKFSIPITLLCIIIGAGICGLLILRNPVVRCLSRKPNQET